MVEDHKEPDTQEVISAYLDHLAVERNASPHTLSNYGRDLRRYAEWLAANGRTLATVSAADLAQFIADLRRGAPELGWRPLAESSAARTMVAVRSLHRFAVAEGELTADATATVSPPEIPSSLPHALSVAEVDRLIEACPVGDGTNPIALRDRALVELLYGTGMRVSEALSLDLDSIDREYQMVRVVGKGRKERIVPVGKPALDAVDAWVVRGRPRYVKHSDSALFLNARGQRLGRQSAWKALQAAGERAGLSQAVGPHTLRHSYATHLLQGGADIRVVQELLGHANVTTTQIYTAVTIENLRDVYAHSHPRS